MLYVGENLGVMKSFDSESVDLIYLDPPFFSQSNYGEYDDRWDNIDKYILFLRHRLIECRRLLKDTGNLYLHCDISANYHIRILLDDVFGKKCFRNEIIWWYENKFSNVSRRLATNFDTIFVYAKTDNNTFNKIKVDYEIPKKQAVRVNVDGKADIKRDENGKPIYNIYKKKTIGSVWKIPMILDKKYPTEKPFDLLERIIASGSNDYDVVLDPFLGSGVSVVAARKLGRKYIGIDINQKAINIAQERLDAIPKSLFEKN